MRDNEVKNIAEFNLLHDIINTPELTKNINICYSPTVHRCVNTRKGRAKFTNFQIILDSACISKIVIIRLVNILGP